jgi:oligopeptide/dipeptide ABC transporter ATP-binding protein
MYLGNIVEVLPGETIAKQAQHPYTRALLGAQFSLHMDFSQKIESIESEAPSPLHMPDGCPFRDRCAICTDRCKTDKPTLTAFAPGHAVACHQVRSAQQDRMGG